MILPMDIRAWMQTSQLRIGAVMTFPQFPVVDPRTRKATKALQEFIITCTELEPEGAD